MENNELNEVYDLPVRGANANSAKSVLYEEFNDIDIYIEDTADGYEKIFHEIMSRVFDGKYLISKIFPLGDRGQVIATCRSHNSARPSLYIIDGDLYCLCGERTDTNIPGLYTLPFYCIENLLINQEAIHQALNEECIHLLKEDAIDKFSYDAWMNNTCKPLLDLFIEYALSFSLNPAEPTVSIKVSNYLIDNSGHVDASKINKKIYELMNKTIAVVGEEDYRNKKEIIMSRLKGSVWDDIMYISGKDYLLPLIFMRMRKISNSTFENIKIKMRISTRCSIDAILDCHDYVLSA
ncbi:DUF4435 domain-containing protein [Citrobacter freundii]|uniref:DUF4435 domain-containing protein n=1 Tax=Citrobacter freundii TaxID=546 RepID=UPI0015E9D99C|nr:DUF4435 domain-containing protein [Citrobacter freundii]QMD26102.1 DUF4435 domain-containing protein [Citrobacter freundii]